MKTKFFCFLFTLALLALFSGCKYYNLPMADFIEYGTGIAGITGHSFTTDRHVSSTVAIPPDEETIISLALINPQNYNLVMSLEGKGSDKASVELSDDEKTAFVKISSPERLDIFELTVNITANGRPMPSYKLPVMESRSLNTDIEQITITPLFGPQWNEPLNPALSESSSTEFHIQLDAGAKEIHILVEPPEGAFSSYTIDGQNTSSVEVENDAVKTVNITVIADSGLTKVYSLAISVGSVFNAQTPNITAHPQNRNFIIGENIELSLTAVVNDGGSLSYQWYRNTTSSNTGGNLIPGANASIYQFPAANLGTFYYYCEVKNEIEDNDDGGQKTASINSNAAAIVVDRKPITITGVTAIDRAYNGTTTVALSGGSLVGIVPGDTVGFNLGTGTIPNADAGSNKQVTTNITLTGADAGKYLLSQPTGITVNINPNNFLFTYTLPVFTNHDPQIFNSGMVLSRSGGNSSAGKLKIENEQLYEKIEWYFDDSLLGEGAELTLDVSDLIDRKPYNILGTQTVYAEVYLSGGGYFIKGVNFEVRP